MNISGLITLSGAAVLTTGWPENRVGVEGVRSHNRQTKQVEILTIGVGPSIVAQS
jgi:hypothetical protein